jgi:excinuclease ABC subunit A
VPVYAGYTPAETRRALKRKEEPSYMGTFTSREEVRAPDVRDDRERADEEARVAYIVSADCPQCRGKRLRKEALSVTFGGLDIADFSRLPLKQLAKLLEPYTRMGRSAR